MVPPSRRGLYVDRDLKIHLPAVVLTVPYSPRPSRRSRSSLPRRWYVRVRNSAGASERASNARRTSSQRWAPTNSLAQGTTDVRIDPQLNKKVWEQGVKGVAYRIRVRISRRRNDEEGAKEKLYSYVQAVNVKNPKGLHTVVVEE